MNIKMTYEEAKQYLKIHDPDLYKTFVNNAWSYTNLQIIMYAESLAAKAALKCRDCRYYHWFHDDGLKNGCSAEPYENICSSFVKYGQDPFIKNEEAK